MISERPNQSSALPANRVTQTSADEQGSKTALNHEPSEDVACHQATVIVRGETVRDQSANPAPKGSTAKDKKDEEESPGKEVSEAKLKLRSRLPGLHDDADIGVPKEQV